MSDLTDDEAKQFDQDIKAMDFWHLGWMPDSLVILVMDEDRKILGKLDPRDLCVLANEVKNDMMERQETVIRVLASRARQRGVN